MKPHEPIVITFQSEDGLLITGEWILCEGLPGHALDVTTHQIHYPAPEVQVVPAPGAIAMLGLCMLAVARRRRIRR